MADKAFLWKLALLMIMASAHLATPTNALAPIARSQANAGTPRGKSYLPAIWGHNNKLVPDHPRHRQSANQTAPRQPDLGLRGWRLQMTGRRFPADVREIFRNSRRRLRHISAATTTTGSYAGLVSSGDGGFLTASTATGEPAVPWIALVDTGSDLVWRQCRPCSRCYSSAQIFDPAASFTFRRLPCGSPACTVLSPQSSCRREYPLGPAGASTSTCAYAYHYGDGSFTAGDLATDTLTLPDSAGRPTAVTGFVFGCGHDNENSDFSGADGIIGLGRGPLSLLSQLHVSRFSYCLQSMVDLPSRTSPLFLGAAASISVARGSAVRSTRLIQNPVSPSFYYVNLAGVSVGGYLAPIPHGAFQQHGVILDSGTTLTYLARPAYSAIADLFRALVPQAPAPGDPSGGESLVCYDRNPVMLPEIVFHLEGGGADMVLPVENYMVNVGGGTVCLTIAPSDDISIIGNIQQQNFHILYDLQAELLSFAAAQCDDL